MFIRYYITPYSRRFASVRLGGFVGWQLSRIVSKALLAAFFSMTKTFLQLRNEAENPLEKLYYEILSRFHTHDYDIAINSMSEDLRVIIISCNYFLSNRR